MSLAGGAAGTVRQRTRGEVVIGRDRRALRSAAWWPGGDARRSTGYSYALPVARRMESFADTNATSSASTRLRADPVGVPGPRGLGGGRLSAVGGISAVPPSRCILRS